MTRIASGSEERYVQPPAPATPGRGSGAGVVQGPAAAGVAAAAVGLSVGEMAGAFLAGPLSLVESVGAQIIERSPAMVSDAAIDVLGAANKPTLVVGVVVAALLLGAVLGRLAARRFAFGALGFGAFGALGASAALADDAAVTAIVAAASAVAAGVAVLAALLRRVPVAEPSAPGRTEREGTATSRRRFLRAFGLAVVGAAGVAGTGRWLLARRHGEAVRQAVTVPGAAEALPTPPPGARLAVEGISPLFVPNDEFYRIDTALTPPRVDPAGWELRVTGLVDRQVTLTYDELLGLADSEADVTLSCVSNDVGGDLVGNARWQGIRLDALLERAGVRLGAEQVIGRSVDGWTGGFPLDVALDGRDALVAVAMNGEPLPSEHGFPARLVVPGLYGYVSATKWLAEIELTTWDVDGYWVPRGWAKEGPVKTSSRIDVPAHRASVEAGDLVVAGVAWAPAWGIAAVEVAVDDGDWQACDLAADLADSAWRQWRTSVALEPGEHRLAVRATDGRDRVQTARETPPRPDGASGHHQIGVTVA